MFIARVCISNYRCFRNTSIEFAPGVTVLIGENNSGKTALLDALGLVFSGEGRHRPDLHDFNRGNDPSTEPPKIEVSVTLRSEGDSKDTREDKALVAGWLTQLKAPWEAQLTYRFFLPDENVSEFGRNVGEPPTQERFQDALEQLLPKYVSRVYGGEPSAALRADPELLAKLEYRFVGPIRDVASELFSGSNPLFKRMLQQVLDNDLDREVREQRLSEEDRQQKQSVRRTNFRERADSLADGFRSRVDLKALTELVAETGAEDGGTPILQGRLDETDLLSSLRLFIRKGNIELPAPLNGLGYNNLVYISLLLKSLEFRCDRLRSGQNAVSFPMLAIEEPEAHLHPALQYKLLRFIVNRTRTGSRQVIITTHSSHITAAAGLDALVCLAAPKGAADPVVSYPGRAFGDDNEGKRSKDYVARFLDATKSTMLFSKGVILVEGLAEQLVLPVLAEFLVHLENGKKVPLSLEARHVTVVAVGGSTFKHFLPLFGPGCARDREKYALRRPVACVVDSDPARKEKTSGARFKKCWPYELDHNPDSFEYRAKSAIVAELDGMCCNDSNPVGVFPAQKTFEYDLALDNVTSEILQAIAGEAGPNQLDDRTQNSLNRIEDDGKRHAATFASRYLLSVEDRKGEAALELSRLLRQNLEKQEGDRLEIMVPDYVARAVKWACGLGDEGASR